MQQAGANISKREQGTNRLVGMSAPASDIAHSTTVDHFKFWHGGIFRQVQNAKTLVCFDLGAH